VAVPLISALTFEIVEFLHPKMEMLTAMTQAKWTTLQTSAENYGQPALSDCQNPVSHFQL
jgi:hypothetical protein